MVNKEMGIEIDIREIFQIILKHIRIIIAITFITTSVGFFISHYVLKPVYEAKISVVIIKAQENIEHQQYDYNDIVMYQDLIKTYAQIARSRTVAENALEMLKLNNIKSGSLLGQLITKQQGNTQIMDLMVVDLVPIMAKEKLNALTDAFIEEATRIFPNGNVEVIDYAVTPQNPISPNKKRNVILSFFFGLLGSIGFTLFIEKLDNTIKSEEDVEKNLGIIVIGVIPS